MKIRKGFTLVELLIVIVIIGILAAAMMLSGGSSVASAEAARIIYDLRDLKTACLHLYAERFDDPNLDMSAATIAWLKPYVADPNKLGEVNGNPYSFEITTANGETEWWLGYNLAGVNQSLEVAEKLIGKAKSIGLYKDKDHTLFFDDKSDTEVWMLAR